MRKTLPLLLLATIASAAPKTVVTGARLQRFTDPGSLGEIHDTIYVRCFWPTSDQAVALFDPKSSGIEVEGPPTPRNIIFPPDTVFHPGTRGDCFYKKEVKLLDVVKSSDVTKTAFVDGADRLIVYTTTFTVTEPVEVKTEIPKTDAAAAQKTKAATK